MAADPAAPALPALDRASLARQWRALTRVATGVAVLTAPAVLVWLHDAEGWSVGWSIAATVGLVIAFRGLIDISLRRFLPWPSLFSVEDQAVKEDDVVNRRRAWYWRRKYAWVAAAAGLVMVVFVVRLLLGHDGTWLDSLSVIWHWLGHVRNVLPLLVLLPVYLLFNFLILFGPLMLMGISQIRAFEPGDADWGVRLDHVRGQAEAKEEVKRIVNLWQSGEAFERAGGKRERGILFLGAPGTGKTMLAKAIATGFNAPFVSIPGSGFAQSFIGMDAVIVRFLARKAKRLAAKWGGQCIVFIDEIDAVGMRRAALQGAPSYAPPQNVHDVCFFGENGALTPTGDLVLQSRAWRDKVFAQRHEPAPSPYPPFVRRLGGIVNQALPGGMFGGTGQLALNQLLVVMDGIDNPPFMRRVLTNKVNTWLDASYVVPRRLGRMQLRLPQARPASHQIYFIGATNVPIDALDPALTRAGRLGRHIWFRTPTKNDRLDILELYLAKVAHEPELDEPRRRDELARITNGYSPAMIEQVCSMALTYAHHNGRDRFDRPDLLEAMTTIEAGTAIGWDYIPEEARATAIHEAGHAATAHVFLKGAESTRLSIRRRGYTGGHHQAAEKEERFGHFRSEEVAHLIWSLGAMAAEYAFYGENTNGVGGDVASATSLASAMVGAWAMGPPRVQLNGGYDDPAERRAAEDRIMQRFEEIGLQILRRSGTGPNDHDPSGAVLGDRAKRAFVAQLLGQAFVSAYHLIRANREGVDRIARALLQRKEIYGDELLTVLDEADLRKPDVDLTRDEAWPIL